MFPGSLTLTCVVIGGRFVSVAVEVVADLYENKDGAWRPIFKTGDEMVE